MKVLLLLADKGTANPNAGTLNILNVGWGVTHLLPTGQTAPSALAVFFEAELAECNRQHTVVIELLDEDGHSVSLPGPAGPQPMRIQNTLVVVPPPGAPTGTVGRANIYIEFSTGLPIPPGTYRWKLTVDGQEDDNWVTSFWVAPPPTMPHFGYPPRVGGPPQAPG